MEEQTAQQSFEQTVSSLLGNTVNKTPMKSLKGADKFREEGNAHYKDGRFYEALVAYNESICRALLGSEQLALAYSNRSVIYRRRKMFKKCLENIQLARANNSPAAILAKLDEREATCKKLMETERDQETAKWDFFQLSYPPNEKIPFIVEGLELNENDQFGRHIITTKELKAGDIVAIEEPFFKTINEDVIKIRCSNCLKSNALSLIPCGSCTAAMYCSPECQSEHFQFIHALECETRKNIYKRMRVPVSFLKRAMSFTGGVEELQRLLSDPTPRTVFDFDLNNPKDPSYKRNLLLAVNSLSTSNSRETNIITEFPAQNRARLMNLLSIDQRTEEERQFLFELFCRCLSIHNSNQYQMKQHSREVKEDTVNIITNQLIGNGLFPFASLFNHSCEANVKRITVDNKFAIVVVRPIKAGEQLFISYGFGHYNYTREERQLQLAGWGFECSCEACIDDFAMIDELPKKDPSFAEPNFPNFISTPDAIAQFNKNCDYINDNITKYPSYETVMTCEHNDHLMHQLATDRFDEIDLQSQQNQPA